MSKDQVKRTWVVTTLDHCNECKELKAGVETRTWNNGSWVDRKTFTLNSCKSCYDSRMQEEIEKDKPDPYDGYC